MRTLPPALTGAPNSTLDTAAKIAGFLRDLAIFAEDWKESLALASLYGEFSQRNLVDKFHDYSLQNQVASKVPHLNPKKLIAGDIHYISEPYVTGGHTSLLTNYIIAQIDNGARPCVITRRDSIALSRIREAGVVVHHIEKFEKLLSCELTGALYLHAHPWDIESCILADRASGSGARILFINHADHCFHFHPNFDVTYLEVSGLGRSISQLHRGVLKQSFLGIPVNIPVARWKPSQETFLLTIARREKLRPRDDLNFPKIADSLTRKYNIKFIIAGQTGQESWWSEYLDNKYLDFRGSTSAEESLKLLTDCSAYIDSFPLTGGTVLALAGSLGVPIFSLKSIAYGYNAAESIRKQSISEVLTDLDNYLKKGEVHYNLDEMSDQIRAWHSMSAFRERVSKIDSGELVPFPSWAPFSNVELQEVRRELFSSVSFPMEIPISISLFTRIKIVTGVLKFLPEVQDATLRSISMSLIGQGGQIHRILQRVRSVLIARRAL
ncbi:hypothetical protein GC173_18555 [bacterium]|nr:hypothetical protein [bacterium]